MQHGIVFVYGRAHIITIIIKILMEFVVFCAIRMVRISLSLSTHQLSRYFYWNSAFMCE